MKDLIRITSIMVSIAMTLAALIIGYGVLSDILKSDECNERYPNEDFCKYIKEGVKCGYKCKDLNLDFLYFDSGGMFTSDKCSCVNPTTKEVVRLY